MPSTRATSKRKLSAIADTPQTPSETSASSEASQSSKCSTGSKKRKTNIKATSTSQNTEVGNDLDNGGKPWCFYESYRLVQNVLSKQRHSVTGKEFGRSPLAVRLHLCMLKAEKKGYTYASVRTAIANEDLKSKLAEQGYSPCARYIICKLSKHRIQRMIEDEITNGTSGKKGTRVIKKPAKRTKNTNTPAKRLPIRRRSRNVQPAHGHGSSTPSETTVSPGEVTPGNNLESNSDGGSLTSSTSLSAILNNPDSGTVRADSGISVDRRATPAVKSESSPSSPTALSSPPEAAQGVHSHTTLLHERQAAEPITFDDAGHPRPLTIDPYPRFRPLGTSPAHSEGVDAYNTEAAETLLGFSRSRLLYGTNPIGTGPEFRAAGNAAQPFEPAAEADIAAARRLIDVMNTDRLNASAFKVLNRH